jgi:hypothetical protein
MVRWFGWFMVFVILWQTVFLAEQTRVPGENHWPVASHWQTLSHNVVWSKPRHERLNFDILKKYIYLPCLDTAVSGSSSTFFSDPLLVGGLSYQFFLGSIKIQYKN